MNHRETIIKWLGKKYIEPGMDSVECVGWAKLYCKERGYPIKSFGGSAINGWVTGSPFDSSWVRIVNTGKNAPSEGDLIFYDERRCANGHVSIANKFCFPFLFRHTDQNGTGKRDSITNRFDIPKYVVGWFHKK